MPILLNDDYGAVVAAAVAVASAMCLLILASSVTALRCYASNPYRTSTRTISLFRCCVSRTRERRAVGEGRGVMSQQVSWFATPRKASFCAGKCRVSVSVRLTVVLLALVSAVVIRPVGARSGAISGSHRSSVDASSGRPGTAPDCSAVHHDSLWQRLSVESTDYDHSRTRLAAMPAETVDDARRRKRSMTGDDDGGVEEEDAEEVPKRKKKVNLMKLANDEKEEEDEEGRRKKRRKGMRMVTQQTRQRRRTDKRKTEKKKAAVTEPWQCRMEQKWKKMDDGVFPPYVQTGRCKQKCMMEMYQCTPRKYVIKVLKKVDAACFPVPVVAVNSTYEEAWTFADYKVTVGCECVKRSPGRYLVTESQSQS